MTMPGRDWRELTAIFAGGALGAVLRVALVQTGAGRAPGWPWITFGVNVAGAFLLGLPRRPGCRSGCRCRPTAARCSEPASAVR